MALSFAGGRKLHKPVPPGPRTWPQHDPGYTWHRATSRGTLRLAIPTGWVRKEGLMTPQVTHSLSHHNLYTRYIHKTVLTHTTLYISRLIAGKPIHKKVTNCSWLIFSVIWYGAYIENIYLTSKVCKNQTWQNLFAHWGIDNHHSSSPIFSTCIWKAQRMAFAPTSIKL